MKRATFASSSTSKTFNDDNVFAEFAFDDPLDRGSASAVGGMNQASAASSAWNSSRVRDFKSATGSSPASTFRSSAFWAR